MEKRYVDKTALEHFILKIKSYLNNSLLELVKPNKTKGWQSELERSR